MILHLKMQEVYVKLLLEQRECLRKITDQLRCVLVPKYATGDVEQLMLLQFPDKLDLV